MAEMQETVQIVLDTGDIAEITRFLEEMKITQGEDGHPDWWQPFIDDIENAMAEWHTDLWQNPKSYTSEMGRDKVEGFWL